jgi:molybdenum cofactor cytidylyltransferase
VIQGILLAAGSSRRFGSNKLLHPLADGTLMAVAAARTLVAVSGNAMAVVRQEDVLLMKELAAEGLGVTVCKDAHRGMGASLASGIRATLQADGWIIALADMPYIRTSTITAVYEALRDGAPLVAPVHAGERGHPVAIGGLFREQLLMLRDDFGARKLLNRYDRSLKCIQIDDPGILQDIDIPADIG